MFSWFDLYCVCVCIFVIYIQFSFPYCLFVSNSQVIGCEDHLRNDLYCVGWGVKLCSIQSNQPDVYFVSFYRTVRMFGNSTQFYTFLHQLHAIWLAIGMLSESACLSIHPSICLWCCALWLNDTFCCKSVRTNE